ncbi:thiolase family protein [Leucobacter sp. NPDC015123]|uniref:thiolase family protein n=1 Tax=Leucobacter sp. NPDC015123 TaxID=3364129 RepID=UPI0036F4AF66
MVRDALIFDAVRTPRGRVRREGGTLSDVPSYELLAGLLTELSRRGLPAELVDDVIVGVSTPVGEQGADLARVAISAADWPDSVSGGVVSRMCCSGLDAIASGAAQVLSGGGELVVAGGAESMSRTPMFADNPAFALDEDLADATGFVTIGVAADFMAARFGISRAELDDWAVRSHALSLTASVPASVVAVERDGETLLGRDEGARPGLSAAALAELPALCGSDPTWERALSRFAFEGLESAPAGRHTVATAPQLADAASAVLLGTAAGGHAAGLKPRGRIVSWAHAAVRSPGLWAGEHAARKALARAELGVGDIAVAELNESFAVTPVLLGRQLGIAPDLVNAHGGALALGHPLGASGGILLATAIERLGAVGGGYGLLVIPAALGLATAVVVEAFG